MAALSDMFSIRARTGSGGPAVTGLSAVVDLVSFSGTVLAAYLLHWRATDIIWGLWTSSLFVGYSTLMVGIIRGARGTFPRRPARAIVTALAGVIFFSIHFLGFHYGHSVFLNAFFPLIDSEGPPNLIMSAGTGLALYWPLVIASLLSRFPDLRSEVRGEAEGMMASPYGNVVRMHLLIFVFAGLHIARLSGLAIYPVLAAYFFPWGSLVRAVRKSIRSRRS